MTAIVELPAGACDCHTHVIGDAATYPMVASRHYTPAPASVDDLRAHMTRLGLGRVVVVQPSVYGTDNRCLLDSLDALGGAGRGVAVLDASTTDDTLAAMHAGGVRGLRLNLESSGDRDATQAGSSIAAWADRLAVFRWHLQVFAALETLLDLVERLAGLPVPIVFDHFAMVPASMTPDDDRIQPLLHAMASKRVFVKLSAPYRIAPGRPVEAEATALRWAGIYTHAAPTQVLWASDWPHTDRTPGKSAHEVSAYRDIPSASLARSLAAWLPDEAIRRQVLVDNPARLYGF